MSKVKVVSIPPCTDDANKQENVKSLNACLCVLARETGAQFINNDPAFLLQDESPNDGYLCRDGVHLNDIGTNRLAKNVQLLAKEGHTRNICKDRNGSPNSSGGWKRITHKRNLHQSSRNNMNSQEKSHARVCWNCGERNPVSANCRHGHPIKCNLCHTSGHKAKSCRRH